MSIPSTAKKPIPAEDAAEIASAILLVTHLREGQVMALTHADYGVGACFEALCRTQYDISADNTRIHVVASALDAYTAQAGDTALSGNGYEYKLSAVPRGEGRVTFEKGDVTLYTGGKLSYHVLTARVPVGVSPDLEYGRRMEVQEILDKGGDSGWGTIEQHEGQPVYTIRRAYQALSPDPQAVHELLASEDSRAVLSISKAATSPREAARLAKFGIVLKVEETRIHTAKYQP